jgi:hypothetical protein
VIIVLAGVLAIVALNNVTDSRVAMPVAIALAAGLLAAGISSRKG